MNLESHVAELEEKHRKLEREIESELHFPAIDTLHLAELKRKKLRIKEAIERLRPQSTRH